MTLSLNVERKSLRRTSSDLSRTRPSPERRAKAATGSAVFGLITAAAIATGWLRRGAWPSAESGVGYYLGVIGGVSMLALLLYPLRKHAPFMRKVGAVSFWFRAHMALGLIGPTLILYHANFSFGSVNANVALCSMLTVAGSGIVGRIFYAKIHKGLYGVKADLRNLAEEAAAFRSLFSGDLDQRLSDRFDRIESGAFSETGGMAAAAVKMARVAAEARSVHAELRRRLKKQMRKEKGRGPAREHLDFCNRYFGRIEQAAELGFYERMFSAWHLLHLPLFLLLILTAIIHVVAVHLY